jgi:hypothetical protein
LLGHVLEIHSATMFTAAIMVGFSLLQRTCEISRLVKIRMPLVALFNVYIDYYTLLDDVIVVRRRGRRQLWEITEVRGG